MPDCKSVKALKHHQYGYRLRVENYRVLFDIPESGYIIPHGSKTEGLRVESRTVGANDSRAKHRQRDYFDFASVTQWVALSGGASARSFLLRVFQHFLALPTQFESWDADFKTAGVSHHEKYSLNNLAKFGKEI